MGVIASLAEILEGSASPRGEFAYIDESGDTGPTAGGGSRTFTLGCLLIPMDQWTDRLDILVESRREIRKTYGVRATDEIKANYLLRGRGDLMRYKLGDGQRRDIYHRTLSATTTVASGAFAVVIDKEHPQYKGDAADRAWEYLFQRLRIRSGTSHPIIVVHDDGDADRVRKQMRRFRRISWAPGGQQVSAPLLIEDPIPRDSKHSYFIQAADLAAYAAFRRFSPPGRNVGAVCNEMMWDTLAPVLHTEVNPRRDDAIVVYPYRH